MYFPTGLMYMYVRISSSAKVQQQVTQEYFHWIL